MKIERLKQIGAATAAGAIVTAIALISNAYPDTPSHPVASGSGDSATGTNYVQPTSAAMKLPTTTTVTVALGNDEAPTSISQASFAPTVKATP